MDNIAIDATPANRSHIQAAWMRLCRMAGASSENTGNADIANKWFETLSEFVKGDHSAELCGIAYQTQRSMALVFDGRFKDASQAISGLSQGSKSGLLNPKQCEDFIAYAQTLMNGKGPEAIVKVRKELSRYVLTNHL